MTINQVVWSDAIPVDLGDQLREAYRNGQIKPVNALAELRMAKVPMQGIDELDVGQWLRMST